MWGSKSPTSSSSATDWTLRSVIAICRSLGCCIRTFTSRRPSRSNRRGPERLGGRTGIDIGLRLRRFFQYARDGLLLFLFQGLDRVRPGRGDAARRQHPRRTVAQTDAPLPQTGRDAKIHVDGGWGGLPEAGLRVERRRRSLPVPASAGWIVHARNETATDTHNRAD